MIRRFFCCILAITMLLSLTTIAVADYADWSSAISAYCSVCLSTRAFTSERTSERVHSITYYSTSSHEISLSREYECNSCIARGYSPEKKYLYATVIEAHSLLIDTDGGHVEGTRQHLRNLVCSKCGSFTITKYCDGPPCSTYRLTKPTYAVE